MERAEAAKKFRDQRNLAKERGIEWGLTFEQWLTWWGSDIEKRGRKSYDLCMQRVGDVGPYSLDNIRKGTVRENAKTRGKTRRNVLIAPSKYKRLFEVVEEPPDEISEDEAWLKETLGMQPNPMYR